MKSEAAPVDTNGKPSTSSKDAAREIPDPRSLRDRATGIATTITGLSKKLDGRIRRDPYSALAVACAVGLGAGTVLSSRIVRAIVVSAATHAIVEIGRAYLKVPAAA
jgi:hypothetical protein